MANEIIRVDHFSYGYEGAKDLALKQVSFSVNEGEFLGIVGCNKAGKSTLCQAMVGVLPYVLGGRWEGTIHVAGKNLEDSQGNSAAEVIGIVFQDAESQFTQETVEDEIAFAMCNFGYERALMRQRVEEASRACGLFDMLSRSPFRLSGGQQQRLAVACILALRPRVIILDESTSQLDPIGRNEVFTLVKQLHAAGRTIIMVDHNIEKIAEYADRVLVMHEGEIKINGCVREVFGELEALRQLTVRVPQVTAAAGLLKSRISGGALPVNLDQAKQSFAGLRRTSL
ncbi:MAG: ABC transporter ATP-binding protein [Clostridiaceae bacterium]